MKTYPKKKLTTFTKLDSRQINIHLGRVWNYWFISPYRIPFKAKKGCLPVILKVEDLDNTILNDIK